MPGPDSWFNNWKTLLLILSAAVVILFMGYGLSRESTLLNIGCYTFLFTAYLLLYKQLEGSPRIGIFISISFRLLLLFSIPALSDDFYRFIWDGRLLAAGVNPFHEVPEFYMLQGSNIPGINLELFESLNFKIYHTMYAPVAQFTGWIAVLIGGESVRMTVLVMRLFIIVAEIGSIFLIYRLLQYYKMNSSRVLLYALNPLVIFELTGNLHHEAYVIFFLLLTVYFFHKNNLWFTALAMSMAIASKLIPLIFLPLFLNRFSIKRLLLFYTLVMVFTIALFSPFLDNKLFYALIDSGWLYFQRFEFNGSIYYLVREVGFWVKGYNIIQTAGRWMAALTFLSIGSYIWFERNKKVNIFEALMWILTLYLVFATTLHPWYILPLISFCVFTTYRYAIIWSILIFLSYAGYSHDGYSEPIYLIVLEYLIVYAVMIYEISRNVKPQLLFRGPS